MIALSNFKLQFITEKKGGTDTMIFAFTEIIIQSEVIFVFMSIY